MAEEEVYATFARMEADRAERRGARAPASAGTKRAEPALAETKRAEPAAASAAPPPPPQPPISSDIFDPSDVELCDEERSTISPLTPDGMKLGPQSQPKSDAGLRTKLRFEGSDQTWKYCVCGTAYLGGGRRVGG